MTLEMDIPSPTSIILCLALGLVGADDLTGCKSPQYLKTGTRGTVSCSFNDDFFSVYWYDTNKYVTTDAIIEYQGSIKRGGGYESGIFDVHQNGSLIINNVTLRDDHFFTAIELRSVDDYNRHYVRVIATVKPANPYPVIESCGKNRTLCYIQLPNSTELECYVRDARPTIALTWMYKTANADKNLSFVLTTTSNGLLNTSTATTNDLSSYASGLNLLVCEAHDLHGLLMHTESLVIVETDMTDLSHIKPISMYVRMNSRLDLPCSDEEVTLIVWKHKHKTNGDFYVIAYAVYGYNNTSTFQSEGYNLANAGALIIPEVRPEHEGLLVCIGGNGSAQTTVVYNITAYVLPDPAYLVVEGCSPHQYCVLDVKREGILTCTVKGIRPKVKLTWKTFYDTSSDEVLFYNQETTVTSKEDDTYDVVLTTHYDACRSTKTKLTIECEVSERTMEMFPFTTKLDLLFVQEGAVTTDSSAVSKQIPEIVQNISWIPILAVVLVILIILVSVVLLFIRGKCLKAHSPKHDDGKDVNVPMLQPHVSNSKLSDNKYQVKETFITQLKTKYADLTATVCPVPYLRESLYSVNDVFVESGFEFLLSGKKWEMIESYAEIFSDSRLTSSRRIIEGDAGYGKSTLALQFAYDWCNNVDGSPLTQKDIFILLQLRQLGGMKSLFEAIKYCLLPKDTQISCVDIESILQESKSIVIVLDGYDEYPEKGNETKSFVKDIIKRVIMQQMEVILTTRTACLPKEYSPRTKRIRMLGFDDIARESYLRKVLVGDDNKMAEIIKEKLNENPFLEDVCHIPLFFVLFSHLSNEKETFALKYNSVTTFFRHIISCLHSHRRNKETDPTEQTKLDQYKEEHTKLDKVAFEGLGNKSQKLVWEKETLCQKLGEDFYNEYVSLGILVEEKVLYVIDDPRKFVREHIQHRQEVRFYHKLFCEWYAAHFLADCVGQPEVNLDPRHDGDKLSSQKIEVDFGQSDTNGERQQLFLDNLDPSDVQYLYRFACGIDCVAAEKICQYVTNAHGGDKFGILCLIEQTGKLETIKPNIEKLCARTITFRREHSKLLQRSTIQILEIAAKQQIPIAHLWFCDCFKEVCESAKSILLESGVKITTLHTLVALDVRESDREITKEETIAIVKYCLQCRELKTLKFKYCLMPLSVPTEQLSAYQEKPIRVLWDTGFTSPFILNLENGLWQHPDNSGPLTKVQYEKEVEEFQKQKS